MTREEEITKRIHGSGGRYPYYLIGKMNAVVNANKAYGQAQEEYSKIYYEKY